MSWEGPKPREGKLVCNASKDHLLVQHASNGVIIWPKLEEPDDYIAVSIDDLEAMVRWLRSLGAVK